MTRKRWLEGVGILLLVFGWALFGGVIVQLVVGK